MKIEEVKPNQIYRNTRNHLVTRHGRHICYIDIAHDAIVYTELSRLKSEDWELLLPVEMEIVTEDIPPGEPAKPIVRKAGRPRKNKKAGV